MNLLKQLLPPLLYASFEKLFPPSNDLKIDSRNRFPGKIFCVGFNKTATTSVAKALSDFGYTLGNQAAAEMLLTDWHNQEFDRIVRYCQTAQAFQDIPFSLPKTYYNLDQVFPDAKFILTVRSSKEQWFRSLVEFNTKLFSSDKNRPPTETDLENAVYRYKGFVLDAIRRIYDYPNIALYDYDYYTSLYEQHNRSVIDHFNGRPDKLLKLDVSEQNAYQKLAAFLNIQVSDKCRFPWINKTQTF